MVDQRERGIPVTSAHELEAIIGVPEPRTANKARSRLHAVDRAWLAAAPLAFVATGDEHGELDVSPKGDPAGFATVLDDTTIAIPERPGNRRADGFHNVLRNPHVGLVFVIPGRGDTLRVNGRATIVRDAPFIDGMVVRGHRPSLALLVDIDEVFFHCSKAFLRSKAWQPDEWAPEAAPRRAVIAKAVERRGDSLEVLDEYYGPSYAERIYG
ncbi:pyridoxamine 5'-phosphate oxidase family protein [Agromyces sp. SYSU K20354]|uniref:MSMEG_1061 family FMN-dependent PPOX-type flavoprotein n=1 Tax=Agromyces cavernae TaxID=2898659 RepID=UPI001E549CAA|nr:MSMEG_1061 family FMN-dependent PPOX-type flavoprotein [Agromyces cavernae]MCD2441174.1 pyridoxamine 5'-phosphate oxidase family protein [Agromyces cavernae]